MLRRTAAAFTLLMLTTTARADERPARSPSEAAAKKKTEGDEAFRALRYADALRAYEAARAIAPDPVLQYNRGRALEALERFPEAVDALEAFERDAPPELRSRAGALSEHIRRLKKKVATVRLVIRPERARVLVRDVVMGTAPLVAPVRVAAGTANIEVVAEGFVSYTREHYLAGASETVLEIELAPKSLAVAAVAPAPSVDDRRPQDSTSSSVLSKWWFWTAAGAVVAGGAVVAYVVTRPPEPRQGDVGQITAPLLRF